MGRGAKTGQDKQCEWEMRITGAGLDRSHPAARSVTCEGAVAGEGEDAWHGSALRLSCCSWSRSL